MTRRNKDGCEEKLYQDDAYVIGHEAVKGVVKTLSVEEVFCSADNITNSLLEYNITEPDFIHMEVDDIEDDMREQGLEHDFFPVLTMTFVKLVALCKGNPKAKGMARALALRCGKFDGFPTMLSVMNKAENKRAVEGKRFNMAKYKLETLEEKVPMGEEGHEVISEIVALAKMMDTEHLDTIIEVISQYNDEHGHCIQSDVDELRKHRNEIIKMGQQPRVSYQNGNNYANCLLAGNDMRAEYRTKTE